jgi:hypothetical protein
MIARVTLAEIDPVRTNVDDAIDVFNHSVLPALREEEGYEGSYVLLSLEGKVLVLTFWSTRADVAAGLQSGFYGDQLLKFVTVFRSSPGRETYDVVVAEAPVDVAWETT